MGVKQKRVAMVMIFSRYLVDKEYIDKSSFQLETLGGIVNIGIPGKNLIKIDMGKVTFLSDQIPVSGEARKVINENLNINGNQYSITCLWKSSLYNKFRRYFREFSKINRTNN